MANKRIDVLVQDPDLNASYTRLGVAAAYDGRERREQMSEQAAEEAMRRNEELALDMRLASTLTPLKSLTPHHLEELVRNSQIEMVFGGEVLFEAGSYGREHIFLLHGDVRLENPEGDSRLIRASACLGALAHQQPRRHRAVAETDCSILRVDSDYLDNMLTWSQVAEYMLLDIAYQRDLDEDAEWMMTILQSNLFHKVPPINAQIVFDRFEVQLVEAGEAVLRQGELGDKCYFIKQGEAEVRRSPDGMTPPVKIAEIGPGRCFGEDALVNETVRNASVIMKTNGVLMCISKRDFLKLLKEPAVNTVGAEAARQLMDKGTVTIDVRTEEEYAAERLHRAINIPLHLLRIKTRLLQQDTPYLLYCDTGRRSRAAAHLLTRAGFTALALEGGLQELSSASQLDHASDQAEFLLKDGSIVEIMS